MRLGRIVALLLLPFATLQATAQEALQSPGPGSPSKDEVVKLQRFADIPENIQRAIQKVNCVMDDRLLSEFPGRVGHEGA